MMIYIYIYHKGKLALMVKWHFYVEDRLESQPSSLIFKKH